jgi:hypothetical protein
MRQEPASLPVFRTVFRFRRFRLKRRVRPAKAGKLRLHEGPNRRTMPARHAARATAESKG